jgi:hypothetical protein
MVGEIKAKVPELQWQLELPLWLQAPQGVGLSAGQQQWPETKPGPKV